MQSVLKAGLAAICVAALNWGVAAFAEENDDQRSSYVDDRFEYVPLLPEEGGSITVRRILLNAGGEVLSADPGDGVERVDQNRLDWSGVPVVGQLANERYNEADFTRARNIGDAYFADGTVWLDLSDEPPDRDYGALVFLNQKYAYQLNARARPAKSVSLPNQPPGRIIGQVYRGSDGALLVLVRPFIVTDSLF